MTANHPDFPRPGSLLDSAELGTASHEVGAGPSCLPVDLVGHAPLDPVDVFPRPQAEEGPVVARDEA